MQHGAEDLRMLSQLFDACTAMPDSERAAWLNGLLGEAARLRPALKGMLARQSTGDLKEFLESPPHLAAHEADTLADAFKTDDRIGPYQLLRPIGRGGMGEVWLATRSDGQLKRSIALKLPMLSVRRTVLVQRFERERDILGALIHPHIARLYDAGVSEDGQPYMALVHVEGKVITEAADDSALDAVARVRLLRQVMEAVQYAHANLVIHRDLKPDNVLITADGQAKLLDFGIAKLVEDETEALGDSDLTRLSGRALTLRYAAPELINGGAVSTAVDIWALGVLLYELLTGLLPFDRDAESASSIEQQILTGDPTRPSQSRSGAIAKLSRSLASDLDTIAFKALKKQPAERYATVGAFADDLDRWLRGEPVLAQRDSGWYRARRFVGRHKIAVSSAALASTALIAVVSAAVVLGLQAREESARATAARDFMVNIFQRADPDLSQGKEVSAKQLLAQGYKTVLETMDGQPMLHAELLRSIGFAQIGMFNFPAMDEAFAQATLQFQRAENPREAAALTLDRAAIRLTMGWEVSLASGLLTQAQALYPAHAKDEEFMARYATYRSFNATFASDKKETELWYARSRTHADSGLKGTLPRTVLAVRSLAYLDRLMNQPLDGVQRLASLLGRLQADKKSLPSDVLGTLAELGNSEWAAGRYRAAMERYDAALLLCQTSLNARGDDCTYSQGYRAQLLLLLGLDDLAMEAVPFLTSPRGVKVSGDTRRLVQAYEILAKNQKLDGYPNVVTSVVAAGNATLKHTDDWRLKLEAMLAQVRHALREGRAEQAMALSTQAQVLIADRGMSEDQAAWPARALQSICLHMLGKQTMALQQLDSLQAHLVKTLGANHPSTQLFSISRVRPLWALQRQPEAVALIDQALPILREAMGEQAPSFINILQMRAELVAANSGTVPSMQQFEILM